MFRYPGGVRDFVAALDAEAGSLLHEEVIGFEREHPRMAGVMEVAFLWSGSREERMHTFANSLATRQEGTHVDGFREGVAAAVAAYARRRGLLTAADTDLDVARIGEGLTAVVSVKLDRPQFLGATVGLLATPLCGPASGRPSKNTSAPGSRSGPSGQRRSSPDSSAASTRTERQRTTPPP
nr:hypothetical protein OH837_47560 [Streptomyces canus]